jgi:16S rRNA (cytosine1402-N4)-methyltransferase
MKNPDDIHISVLLKELFDGLDIKSGSVVVDATVNGGGMSKEVLERFSNKVKLVCIDADENALKVAKKNLRKVSSNAPSFVCGNFRDMKTLLESIGVKKVDRIIFDLGLSSNQLESSGRGFSFLKNEPLLMTFSNSPDKNALTAFDIANLWETENIEIILRSYGEEKQARKIARAIVEARKRGLIKTSKQLSQIVEEAIRRRTKIHPATKTFQAFRVAVNDEISSLKDALKDGFEILNTGGKIAVISFHSIEDRIVKNFIRDKAKEGMALSLFKKPLMAGKEEKIKNPRSRSAKLRILEKI